MNDNDIQREMEIKLFPLTHETPHEGTVLHITFSRFYMRLYGEYYTSFYRKEDDDKLGTYDSYVSVDTYLRYSSINCVSKRYKFDVNKNMEYWYVEIEASGVDTIFIYFETESEAANFQTNLLRCIDFFSK